MSVSDMDSLSEAKLRFIFVLSKNDHAERNGM